MESPRAHSCSQRIFATVLVLCLALVLAACSNDTLARRALHTSSSGRAGTSSRRPPSTTKTTPATTTSTSDAPKTPIPLPAPATLIPFTSSTVGAGAWTAAGRVVDAVQPFMRRRWCLPVGHNQPDRLDGHPPSLGTAVLGLRESGRWPYEFTAPIQAAQARTLVAAFNGGFKMNAARGGYYTEGRTVVPLVAAAASLVIYANGSVTVGAWGTDVSMAPNVVAVRQNLVRSLQAANRPPRRAVPTGSLGGHLWRNLLLLVCPGIESQWRSGARYGRGALVYAAVPRSHHCSWPSSSYEPGLSGVWNST